MRIIEYVLRTSAGNHASSVYHDDPFKKSERKVEVDSRHHDGACEYRPRNEAFHFETETDRRSGPGFCSATGVA